MQELADHEQRINALAQVDHVKVIEESVKANVLTDVKNHLPKFMPKVVSDFVQPHLERNVLDVMKKNTIDLFKSSIMSFDTLSKYELKKKLYDMMFQIKSFNTHEHHLTLYNALMNSIHIDELVAKGKLDLTPTLKKRYHDDQDPPKNPEGEKRKRMRKNTYGSSSQKDKTPVDLSNYERFAHADEPKQQEQEVLIEEVGEQHVNWFKQPNEKKSIEDDPEQSWFNKLGDGDKDPKKYELQIGSTVMFAKKMKVFLKKDNITRADLERPTFEILKNKFKNSIELEYNLKQCYLAMPDKIDWANPKGDRFHTYLSKPLPLEGPSGRKIIPTRYFFNKDLEYLKHGNQKNKYALSLSKLKAARYEKEGIEEMIPHL
ncbi:hypothetical protein Tco_0971519 [Tanacetum coccineum]